MLLPLLLGSLSAIGCTMNRVESKPVSSAPSVPAAAKVVPLKITQREIGRSVQGRAIEAVRFEGAPGSRPILIFAGIHGDEQSTVAVARRLVELLRTSFDRTAPTLVVVALANPDGFEVRTRANSRGIDLNRNFPAENFKSSQKGRYANGTQPLSEPESVALHDLVEELKPARILTIHSIRPPRHGNNFDGPAESLAKLMASKNGYNVLPTMGYATPGSFGSWAGVDRQIPTITLELPSNAPAERAWNENREALLAFIRGR